MSCLSILSVVFSYRIKKEILPLVQSLCQDVKHEVRACMCRQLDLVAKGLGYVSSLRTSLSLKTSLSLGTALHLHSLWWLLLYFWCSYLSVWKCFHCKVSLKFNGWQKFFTISVSVELLWHVVQWCLNASYSSPSHKLKKDTSA